MTEQPNQDPITLSERDIYVRMWSDPDYHVTSPALRDLDRFLSMVKPEPNSSIIDFGCGTAKADVQLRNMGFVMVLIDFVDAMCPEAEELDANDPDGRYFSFFECCLWELNKLPGIETDYGICFDVMEHLPEEKIGDTLEGMSQMVTVGTFFQICTTVDGFGARIGEELHKTVKPAMWWIDRLAQFYEIEEYLVAEQHVYAYAKRKADGAYSNTKAPDQAASGR